MLRQALDAAAEGKKQQEETDAVATSEPTASASTPLERQGLLRTDSQRSRNGYGATGSENGDSMGHSDDNGSLDDDTLDDEWNEEEEADPTPLQRLWQGIKSVFFIVANVENLWDTPRDVRQSAAHAQREQRRRVNGVVGFWFLVLACSYAAERATFKILVDRSGPFRLFAVEMVTASHAIMLGVALIISWATNQMQPHSLGIPVVDVGLMALLDTISLLLVFLTGYHVPPTLTVILVQFTLPLTAFLTQFVHPDGRCSCRKQVVSETPVASSDECRGEASLNRDEFGDASQGNLHSPDRSQQSPDHYGMREELALRGSTTVAEGTPLPRNGGLSAEHVWGSLIIFAAVLLALVPALYSIFNPTFFVYADTIPMMTSYNTLLFVSSCIPAAASQLYKEHIFLQYKQPVNMGYLNILLSIFQFTFASVMSPLVFVLQGLGAKSHWTKLYPSSDFSENFLDGLKCFFGMLDEDDQKHKYGDDAKCNMSLGLVCFHAFSIISVGVAVDKIVSAGAVPIMYRGISAGIILAVLCMHAYDMMIPYFNYGPIVDGLNLACLLLLILGSEVYHRVALKDSTFETVYAEVPQYYDNDC